MKKLNLIGILTGFSVVGDVIQTSLWPIRRTINYISGLFSEEIKQPVVIDKYAAFKVAMEKFSIDSKAIERILKNTFLYFYINFIFILIYVIYFSSYLTLYNNIGIFYIISMTAPIPIMFSLIIRYGYINYAVRKMAISGIKEYILSGDTFPKTSM